MATSYICLLLLSYTVSSASISLSVEPDSVSKLIGDTVEFTCHLRVSSSYDCEEQGFLIWAREEGVLISNSTDVFPNFQDQFSVSLDYTRTSKYTKCHYSLVLHNITKNLAGKYGCVYYPRPEYTKSLPYETTRTSNLMIKRHPAPLYPLCSASILQTGDDSKNMRFRCESEEGNPSVQLYWWFSGYMLDGILTRPKRKYLRLDYIVGKNMLEKFKDSQLLCTITTPGDDDVDELLRSCSISTRMAVTLESRPFAIKSAQETMTTLICDVNSSIPYDLIWYYNGRAIDPRRADDRFLVETPAKALHIRNTTSFDQGSNITCEARSVFGNASATTTLNIGKQSYSNGSNWNTGIIAGVIAMGFLVLIMVNVAMFLTSDKRSSSRTYDDSKNYSSNSSGDPESPMDSDEDSDEDLTSDDTMERPDSSVLMMPDLSENGIRYANVSRTLSTDTTQSRVPSSVHYQSPLSLNESQDTEQPLALEFSSSCSDISGSQECLKNSKYETQDNNYADLRSLGEYECPRSIVEREDSGVDVRQSYVSMDGNVEGIMEDTYEPIDLNHCRIDNSRDIRPDPPSAPCPKQPKNRGRTRTNLLSTLPVHPKHDEYMDMKRGNGRKAAHNPSRQSMPERLPDDPPTIKGNHFTKQRAKTIASPLTTHKALIRKFENGGPDKNANHKKQPERKENHNLNKDNFKGIKEKFRGSKENLKNSTENLKQAVFKKRQQRSTSGGSPKLKKSKKDSIRESEYSDLDRVSMSSEGSSTYQQICFARTGKGEIEDSGVYENIDT